MLTQGEVVIICTSLLSSSGYALIAPFFPLELEDKGVSDANIGYIIAIYSLGLIIFSPPVGRYLDYFGYSKMLFGGLSLMGVVFISFGLIDRLESPQGVLKMSLLLRFLQGLAVAMAFTTMYAIVTNKYPHKKTALLCILEATFGTGLIFGPFVGSFLFNQFGFEKTFYIFGSVFLFLTFCLWFFTEPIQADQPVTQDSTTGMSETGGAPTPSQSSKKKNSSASKLKEKIQAESENSNDLSSLSTDIDDENPKLSFLDLLRNPTYLLASLAGCVSQFIYSYMEPILAKRLEELHLT